jgi:predicted metal-dependent peptidase
MGVQTLNMNDPVVQTIVGARVRLLFNYAFFGNLATRLELVDASKWCKTAAVDGRRLYYNREFIKSLTEDELLFLIAHEVLHCVYDHLGRRGGRNAMLFNAANDYIVNATLVEEKMGQMPKGGLLDKRFTAEMTSEEVYRLLEQQYGPDGKGAGGGKGLQTLDEHLELGDDAKEGGKKGSGSAKGDGDGSIPPSGVIEGGDLDPTAQAGDEIGVDYSERPPVYTTEELEAIRRDVWVSVINAIQSNSGNAPAGVKRLVQEFTSPKIDWKQLLAETIQSCFRDDFTFAVPSKRSWGLNGSHAVILPGQKMAKTVDVCCSLDTSGSISDEIFTGFLSEVRGIIEQYEDFRLHIWCIDAAIYNPQVFTPENIDELDSYEPAGGGGNDFPLNWQYMMDNDIEPEMFVVFSDGYPCGSWGDPEYCPTVFVIKNDWDKNIEAPFGITVYMD